MTGRRPRRRRAAVEWHGECPAESRDGESGVYGDASPAPNRRPRRRLVPADRRTAASGRRPEPARLDFPVTGISMGIAMFLRLPSPAPRLAVVLVVVAMSVTTGPAARAQPAPARPGAVVGGPGRAVLQASGLPVAQAVAVGSLPGRPRAGERARSSRRARPRPEDEPGGRRRGQSRHLDFRVGQRRSPRVLGDGLPGRSGRAARRRAVRRQSRRRRLPRAGTDRALAGAQRPDRLPLHGADGGAARRQRRRAGAGERQQRTLSGRLPDGHADGAPDAEERRQAGRRRQLGRRPQRRGARGGEPGEGNHVARLVATGRVGANGSCSASSASPARASLRWASTATAR